MPRTGESCEEELTMWAQQWCMTYNQTVRNSASPQTHVYSRETLHLTQATWNMPSETVNCNSRCHFKGLTMNITPRKHKQIQNERSQVSVFNEHSLEMENKSRPLITGVVLMRCLDRHCERLCISCTCVCVCVCVCVCRCSSGVVRV